MILTAAVEAAAAAGTTKIITANYYGHARLTS